MFLTGFRRFAIGLFKKVHIADVLAQTADTVFAAQAMSRIPFDYAWIGILAYTFQIYFDFFKIFKINQDCNVHHYIQRNKKFCIFALFDNPSA